jgi:RNA polymerase sigma-32 factor
MERRLSGHDMSFDPSPTDDEDYAPSAYLPSPNSDPAVAIEALDTESDTHSRLTEALSELDARSREILSRRWLAESKTTLHELAGEYGVSAERIRQIESGALKKLKTLLAA